MAEVGSVLHPNRRRPSELLSHQADLLQHISDGWYNTLHPMRRGPMYSAYAELRDCKLRRKRAGLMDPPAPTTTPTKKTMASSLTRSVPDFSIACRKENKKPLGTSMTPSPPPPPPASKAALNRLGSISAYRTKEKKRIGGGGMRKSYSCLKELKEFSSMASSSVDGNKNPTTTWMGSK